MVDIYDIPDFPGQPGQRPTPGAPPDVSPVEVVLLVSPLDREYRNVALNAVAVDAFIAAEITAGRAYSTTVERWSPWSPLQLPLDFATGSAFNYGRFSIGGRHWYAFLDADYLNLTDTVFAPTADLWTTYGPTIGYSMVLRGHVAVAASSGGDIGYCLEPEDFTPGDLVGYAAYQTDPLGSPQVLVISTTDLRADPFVTVDSDTGDTASEMSATLQTSGTIEAPQPVGDAAEYAYTIGLGTYEDEFYYPYAEFTGLVPGNTMYRPRAFGAIPSLVDGMAAEGGAFLYPSVGAAITHLSKLAHAPWISDGIQRAILVPGGTGSGSAAVNLTPRDNVPDFTGAPTYHSSYSTAVDYNVTLAADWTAGLPADYDTWTKLRTGPYSAIQIGDRLGSTSDFDPQSIVGLGSLRLHVQGVFHPELDVAAWIVGAGGMSDPNHPMPIPVGVELPHYAVGRDSVLATQAAGLAAERSQSIVTMLTALQKANVDTSFTLASAFTASQFAIAEGV